MSIDDVLAKLQQPYFELSVQDLLDLGVLGSGPDVNKIPKAKTLGVRLDKASMEALLLELSSAASAAKKRPTATKSVPAKKKPSKK